MRRMPRALWVSTVVLGALVASGCVSSRARGPAVFIPSPPEKPRLQVLLTFSTERDLRGDKPGPLAASILGRRAAAAEGLHKPYGAILRHGKLYITDTGRGTIVAVDLIKKRFEPVRGVSGMGSVTVPINLAVDRDDNLYVTDAGRKQVMVYDKTDRHVRTLGDGQSFKPSGIAIHGDRIYVTDTKSQQVIVLDRGTGQEIQRIGTPGQGPGQFVFPTNIAVDRQGNIYVSEALAGRVQKFAANGKFLQQFGELGQNIGQLVRPRGVAVDGDGNLYVADAATEHCQIYDAKGRLLLFFGGDRGTSDSLYLPAGVSITDDPEALRLFAPYAAPRMRLKYLLVIVSQYGSRRLSIFGFIDHGKNG